MRKVSLRANAAVRPSACCSTRHRCKEQPDPYKYSILPDSQKTTLVVGRGERKIMRKTLLLFTHDGSGATFGRREHWAALPAPTVVRIRIGSVNHTPLTGVVTTANITAKFSRGDEHEEPPDPATTAQPLHLLPIVQNLLPP